IVPRLGEALLQTGELTGVVRNDRAETEVFRRTVPAFLLHALPYCLSRGATGWGWEWGGNGSFWFVLLGVGNSGEAVTAGEGAIALMPGIVPYCCGIETGITAHDCPIAGI